MLQDSEQALCEDVNWLQLRDNFVNVLEELKVSLQVSKYGRMKRCILVDR
jgi:hypothetical protein